MILIGIDVAKDKHDCHIMKDDGEVLEDFFRFTNDLDGFEHFLDKVKYHVKSNNNDNVRIALEYTGHYSNSLIRFLSNNHLEFYAMHPLTIKRIARTKTLRNIKTDKSDCKLLAETLLNYDRTQYEPVSKTMEELKTLCRCRSFIQCNLKRLKVRYRRVLQIVFPELEKIVNVNVETTIKLLQKYNSPDSIANESNKNFSLFLEPFYHGNFKSVQNEIKEKAKQSIGCGNIYDFYELKMLCDGILFLLNNKKETEDKINKIMHIIDSPITTIPGIGTISGAIILSEIGDVNLFSSPEKILAFAGCDPSIYQSGKFTAVHTPIAKKGSSYLRSTLYQVTVCSQFYNPVMKEYIQRKMKEGKHYYSAIMHGVKKMVRIIYAVLKNNKPFEYKCINNPQDVE